MTRWLAAVLTALGLAVLACGGSSPETRTSGTTSSPRDSVTGAALPLGDGKVSTEPRRGYVWSCTPGNPNAPGAQVAGPWISGSWWYPARKVHVGGDVQWPKARYAVTVKGDRRVITGNRLPVNQGTGVFPVASSDPASAFDRNPNRIVAAPVRAVLPARPKLAARPSCLGFGAVGILNDGVLLFDALDAQGRDAVAHEVLDRCDGHPAPGGVYHHHDVPSCLLRTATGRATLVGYAFDGFGIYVERDSAGRLPTDADLDACHGRTSVVPWNGAPTRIYHYDATAEYPYTIGCFRGDSAAAPAAPAPGGPPPAGPQ